MNESLEIFALGGLSLRRNGIPLPSLTYRKAEALLLYLATTRRPHSRDHLATLLWDDTGQERALSHLRVLLSHLRPHFAPFLSISRQTIAFIPTVNASFDVRDFEHKLQSLRQPGPPDLDLLRQAVELYRGDFLAGFFVRDAPAFEEWQNAERDRLQQEYLAALEILLMADLAQGHYTRSATWSERVLQLDPLREVVHRRRMRALALAGQTGAALAQYERCRQVLASELDSQPGSETTALWEQIRSGQLKPSGSGAASQLVVQSGSSWSGAAVEQSTEIRTTGAAFDGYEVPDLGRFYGREEELARLRRWICDERCHVVSVVGIGGMGKTALATQLAGMIADQFERILWRSLVNAPPLDDVLHEWLQILSSQQVQTFPPGLDEQLALLIGYLSQQRCLLVLDNLESILLPGDRSGSYREGYAGYGLLIDRIGQSQHISSLLITSREQPSHLVEMEETALVKSLRLAGLAADAGVTILQERGLNTLGGELVRRYSGNPLALHLVAATIEDMFAGDAVAFLQDEAPIFDDIRDVLDQQFARLAPFEQELIVWLAIEREPVSIAALEANVRYRDEQRAVHEAVQSLKWRSLVEQHGAEFTLQNVVMEYTTDYVLAQVLNELETGQLRVFASHALVKAQAKEYVRLSQVRLILAQVANRLRSRHSPGGTVNILTQTLAAIRADPAFVASYAAGNLLNLLLYLGSDVQGYDFSGLSVWQADLRGMALPEVNFAGADLSGSVFTESFRTINAVTWTPDGRLVAGGAANGAIRLWRAVDGQLAAVFSGHVGEVQGVAFSPDGKLLASSGDDRTVRLWNVQTGAVVHILRGHEQRVSGVAFSRDGTTLASGSDDRTVRLWNVADGTLLYTLYGHEHNISSIAFSPDGTTVASGSWDQTVRLWDASIGKSIEILRGHERSVSGVDFSPDGALLASGSWDQTVRIWSVRDRSLVRTLTGHSLPVLTVAYSADGTTVASGSDDRTVRLWDARTGHTLHTLDEHVHNIVSVAFSPDGATLVSGSGDLTVRFWNVSTGKALRTLRGDTTWIRAMTFVGPDSLLVSGNGDYRVSVWKGTIEPQATSARMLHMLSGHTSWLGGTAFSPDGRLLASAGWDQTIRLWNAQTCQVLHTLRGHTRPVLAVAINQAGTLVASASWDETVRLWDARSGHALHTLHGHLNRVGCIAFSMDDQVLASGGWDQTIRLWDIQSGELLTTLQGHSGTVAAIAFSPDLRTMACSNSKQIIQLWDYATGTITHVTPALAHDEIQCLAFSPDGRLLAIGGADQTVLVWDVLTQQLVYRLSGHTSWVRTLAFHGDGTLLASGSDDETVRVWDLRTGSCLECLHAPQPYAGMNITGVSGLTMAQQAALKALGAVEQD